MDGEQRHLKALLLQLFQGVKDGVMLKGGGNQVGLALPAALIGHLGDDPVVRLAAAGGEVQLGGVRADQRGDGLPGLVQHPVGLLAQGVEGGGIAIVFFQTGQHGVQRRFADAGGGCIVKIHVHRKPSFCQATDGKTL